MGPDSAGSAEKTGDPPPPTPEGTVARRPRGAAWGRGRHSHCTHPRPGRGRPVLRLLAVGGCNGAGGDTSCGRAHGRAGWTRIRLLPLCSGRPGRCARGCSPAEAGARRRTGTAERNDPGTGPGEVKTLRLRPSGRAARGFREEARGAATAISFKTELPRTRQFF